ncbi:homoserine kinase [Mesorhizobium sp. CU2]|uniref:phosphotransferase enzyme family protein n=1 Tax=unclassified Mesorhizobium TaxID=325217 RepID=UPI00112648E5|nr:MULTISPECIES: phosphotransferase [unclassified Mesorhizobium]TPN81078.1 homoserine kinase [Mesorhizobium sp. CU3]TPO11700.1 homoserine kinase [Mesorhizobium sp. CU2]
MVSDIPPDVHATLSRRAAEALTHWGTDTGPATFHTYRENAVLRVMVEGQQAALRLHRPGYHDAEALVSELSWMGYLRANGLLVPDPVRTPDGRLLVTLAGDGGFVQHADLLTWVEGEPLGRSGQPLERPAQGLEDVFRGIGVTLARLHALSDRWTLPLGFQRPDLGPEGILGERPVWGRFWDSPLLSDDQRRRLSEIRTELRQIIANVMPSDFGLIHADLVRENILLAGSDVAFIDFDDCAFGWRLYDLAIVLANNRDEPHYGLIQIALLEGYRSLRPLSAQDEALLPVFILMRYLSYVSWISDRPEIPGAVARLQRYLASSFRQARDFGMGPAVPEARNVDWP